MFRPRKNTPQQEGGEQRQQGPSDPDVMRLYAPLAKETDDLILEFVRIQNAIKTGDRKDIDGPMGDAVFRVRRSNHESVIEKTFGKPPQGSKEQSQLWMSFDRWFKLYAEREYGYDTETGQPSAWVQEHGDQEDWVHHAIYLVMPGQVKKHNHQVEWCEYMGVSPADVITSKARFKELVYEPALQRIAGERPTGKGFLEASKTKQDYLMAVADYDEATRKFRSNSPSRTEIEIWLGLRQRQPRRGTASTAPVVVKSPKEVLTAELGELREKLQGLREKVGKDAAAGVGAEDLGKLLTQVGSTEKDIRDKQMQLDRFTTAPAQPVKSRLEQVKDIVVTEPVVSTPITTVGEKVREKLNGELTRTKADKTKALAEENGKALDAAKAEIARIDAELKKLDDAEKAAAEAAKKVVAVQKPPKKKVKAVTPAAPADVVVPTVEVTVTEEVIVTETTPPAVETDGKVTVAPSDPKAALAMQIVEAAKAANLELVKELRETMAMLG